MKLLKRKHAWRFEKAEFAESTEYLGNPGCGWYHIHAFSLEDEPDMEEMYRCVCKEESLALVILDIGAFREEMLPPGRPFESGKDSGLFWKAGKGIDRPCRL